MKPTNWRLVGLVAMMLSAGFVQGWNLNCEKTGDTTLSILEVEVAGVNQVAFAPDIRSYDLLFPDDTVTVIAQSTDAGAQVTWNYLGTGGLLGVGGGEATLSVPPDYSVLRVYVKAPGGASDAYEIRIIRSSEPGICGSNDHCGIDEGCVGIDPVSCFEGGVGSCAPTPVSCEATVQPVCGCDGVTYTNYCNLLYARVRPSALGPCECNVNDDCDPSEYCNAITCDGPGTCTTAPTSCTAGPGNLIGCDGQTYDSVCDAASNGVRVAGELYPPSPF